METCDDFNMLTGHIKVIEDVLSKEECEYILGVLRSSPLWQPAMINNAEKDSAYRNCDTLPITASKAEVAALDTVDGLIFKAIGKALNVYRPTYGMHLHVTQDTGYEALRYTEGGFYKTHTDTMTSFPRVLTCSIALNDDFTGGEWGFWGEQKVMHVPAGSAVLFPATFIYPHQILPVTKGTRYSIITWLN